MVLVNWDDDDVWKVGGRSKRQRPMQSRSLKNNHVFNKFKTVNTRKSNPQAGQSNHVLVKITGGARTKASMANHFDYISRNNQLVITNEEGDEVLLKDSKENTNEQMENDFAREGTKKTYQVMFSTKGKNDPALLRYIVTETVKKEFPNNTFYVAVHEDTANTHVHVVLLRRSNNFSKRVEINKRKLNQLKKTYAKRLTENGIESHFESETEKQERRIFKTAGTKSDLRKGANIYTVLDYGRANYKFDPNGKESFYLIVKTKNNQVKEHWSLGLKDAIGKNNILRGETVTIKRTNTLKEDTKGGFVRSTWAIEKATGSGKTKSTTNEAYTVVDYGRANYKFDPNGKDSFYLIMKDKQGRQTDLWAKSLEGYIKAKGIKAGDPLLLTGERLKQVKVQNKSKQGRTPSSGMNI